MFGTFDYALTKDQTLRIGYNQEDSVQRNLGIGAFDLPEHAHTNEEHGRTLRIQEAGPLGRRFFTNTRLSFSMNDSSSRSALETPTIRVNDAFTSGGAQVAGGRRTRTFNLASDLDYVRGIHSVRTGIVLERRLVPLERHVELSRDVHVREPRRVRGGHAPQLYAAHRRPEHRLLESAGRAGTSRTTSACARV